MSKKVVRKQKHILIIAFVFFIIILLSAIAVGLIFCNKHTHNLIHHQEVKATCTSAGTGEYWSCEECGKNFSDAEGKTSTSIVTKPALGHDYSSIAYDNKQHWYQCVCGDKKNLKNHSYKWIIDKAATQTESGYKHEECSCGCIRNKDTLINPLNHIHEFVFKAEQPATCTQNGTIEHYHCIKCKKLYADKDGDLELFDTSSPALGHQEIIDPAKPATCTATGLTQGKHCSRCKITLVAQKPTPALGHANAVDNAKPATCMETGLTEGKHCSRCKITLISQQVIPALGHSYTSKVTCEATCYQEGELTYTCTNKPCLDTYTESIPLNDKHTYGEPISKDSSIHAYICRYCNDTKTEAHSLTGADSCSICPYFIPDTAFADSAITDNMLSQRIPISQNFKNVAGVSNGSLVMIAIQVEQGDCIFIKFPDGQTMLMDAGNMAGMTINGGGNHYDNIQAVLNSYGVKQLDYLFITHSDYDHIKYVGDILNDYQVKCIYIPKCSDKSNGNTWENSVAAISKETYTAKNGTILKSEIRYNIGDYEINGDGWRMRCHSYLKADYPIVNSSSASSPTAPEAEKAKIINSLSPICLLEYAGRTIVLTGDSNQYNEEYLVGRGIFNQVDADILKVAHHGSATSNTEAFLKAIKCEYAVVSYGKNNPYSHPTNDVINRLIAVGITDSKLYATASDKDGNVIITINGNGRMQIDSTNRDDRDISIPPITPNNAPVTTLNIFDNYIYDRKKLRLAA